MQEMVREPHDTNEPHHQPHLRHETRQSQLISAIMVQMTRRSSGIEHKPATFLSDFLETKITPSHLASLLPLDR